MLESWIIDGRFAMRRLIRRPVYALLAILTVALGAGRLLDEPERLQRASLRLDAPAWEQAQPLVVNW